MKILVTGGAGFIGSHIVDAYIERGHQAVVVDDLSTGNRSNLNSLATFYQADICSPELADVFEEERPSVISHHAAQADVRRSVLDPILDAKVNILGSLNLLECARRFGVNRFIFGSSGGTVYGEPKYLPCDEAHPVQPISPYGASKHTVEQYLAMYNRSFGLEYVAFRYANVYGPRQNPRGEAGVVAIFTSQMLLAKQVDIYGDGEQTRDFLHVVDCVAANLLALTYPAPNTVYNLGTGRGTSINHVFRALKKITGYSRSPAHAPPKIGETRSIYLDAQRINRDLGWSPSVDVEEGLEETVRWYREHATA